MGARGLRAVIEEMLERVLFDVDAVARYVITDRTARGGEEVKRRMEQMWSSLGSHFLRRSRRKPVRSHLD